MRLLLLAITLVGFSSTSFALDLQLKGKTALVTGSTAGIGYATAEALLKEGADVIINSRNKESVDKAAAALKTATGRAPKMFVGDMSKSTDTDRLAKEFPNVDILVNNVGTFMAKEFSQSTGSGVAADLRDQRALRRAPVTRLSAAHEAAELGPHHFHLERKRAADSGGKHSLRHDEGSADRCGTRPCRVCRKDGHHREQHTARADAGSAEPAIGGHGQADGKEHCCRGRRRVHQQPPPDVPSSSASRSRKKWPR